MTFKNKKGQVIGTLKEGVFLKRVEEKKHLLRIWDAYGIQASVMDRLPSKTMIKIIDETGKVYRATVEDFLHNGKVKEWGDHGKQWFLSRKHFMDDNPTLF